MKKYFELIRIKHWIKNALIFLPMICSGLVKFDNIVSTIIGFFAFSFMCSVIYIINDIRDIENDKLHPRKKKRPLPSGRVKKETAIFISLFLLVLSLVLNTLINDKFFTTNLLLLLSYSLINVLYSCGLKNVAIFDVVLLTAGFVLRVYYGASIINVEVSNWLFLTVSSASLFLGLGKRKKELQNNKESRKVLKEYNYEFLDKFQYISLCLSVVFYSLWSVEQTNENIIFTIPLLLIIFMRYCLIIEKCDEGDPTTILYQDKTLLGICIVYGIIMTYLLVI